MSRLGLPVDELIVISEAWVTPSTPQYKALMAVPEYATLMPRLTRTHQELLQKRNVQSSGSLKQLIADAQVLDERHDRLVRQIYGVLTAFAQVAATDADEEEIERLLALVLPDGLAATMRSYRQEAGATKSLADRLTDAHRAMLKALPLPKGRTVLELVEELLKVGHELGELDWKRKEANEAVAVTTAKDLRGVKAAWHRMVDLMLLQADVLGLPREQFDLIFTGLLAAEQAASQRKKRKKGSAEPSEGDPKAPQPGEPKASEPSAPNRGEPNKEPEPTEG